MKCNCLKKLQSRRKRERQRRDEQRHQTKLPEQRLKPIPTVTVAPLYADNDNNKNINNNNETDLSGHVCATYELDEGITLSIVHGSIVNFACQRHDGRYNQKDNSQGGGCNKKARKVPLCRENLVMCLDNV